MCYPPPGSLFAKLDDGMMHAEDTESPEDGNEAEKQRENAEIPYGKQTGAEYQGDKFNESKTHVIEEIVKERDPEPHDQKSLSAYAKVVLWVQ
jgi:hypothetical protein